MNTPTVPTPEPSPEIEDTLQEVARHWRRRGVPRQEREHRLQELRTHLQDAAREGRTPREVVGEDPTALAAEWLAADGQHPWLNVALRYVAVLSIIIALLLLLGPVAFDLDGNAVRSESLILALVVAGAASAFDVIAMFRARMSRPTAVLLAIAAVVAAGVLGGAATSAWGGQVAFELPLAVAVGLLAVGAVCTWGSVRLWRTRRPQE